MVRGGDVEEGGDGRVVGDLLRDVEALCAVGVVVATSKEFTQNGIISGGR